MPSIAPCFQAYLAAWNTKDPAAMHAWVDAALTPDVVFCDPHYDIRGREAFTAMVREFHKKYPGCEVVRTSGVDQHHNRARYSWGIDASGVRRFDGFDAVELDLASGKIARIDGFFGALPAA